MLSPVNVSVNLDTLELIVKTLVHPELMVMAVLKNVNVRVMNVNMNSDVGFLGFILFQSNQHHFIVMKGSFQSILSC